MLVKIKRVDKDLPLPRYETPGSVAFDLSARETVSINPGERADIPANVVVGTPPGYMLMLAPRSSLCRKKNLVMPNSVGIIDQDYCGPGDELHIQVWNIGRETATIERGERLAQGIFVKIDRADWEETDEISPNDRGRFGTTGGYSTTD
jgi:dUTP pyrophosphatase